MLSLNIPLKEKDDKSPNTVAKLCCTYVFKRIQEALGNQKGIRVKHKYIETVWDGNTYWHIVEYSNKGNRIEVKEGVHKTFITGVSARVKDYVGALECNMVL